MSRLLGISRSIVYYQRTPISHDTSLENLINQIFNDSRKVYGSRKIKKVLERRGLLVSRRKIQRIMKKYKLESKYTLKQYKRTESGSNESEVGNVLDRQFSERKPLEVIVSDLTYVRVLNRWGYVCLIIDLFNREIVGHSCGYHKNAELVEEAFVSTGYDLSQVDLFHSDRGKEYDNALIAEFLSVHGIERSLSNKGCPYDNAVAEATYNIFKIEFCYKRVFTSLEELKLELFDYVNWYNNVRIHGSLGYLTPVEYKSVHINSV